MIGGCEVPPGVYGMVQVVQASKRWKANRKQNTKEHQAVSKAGVSDTPAKNESKECQMWHPRVTNKLPFEILLGRNPFGKIFLQVFGALGHINGGNVAPSIPMWHPRVPK